MTERKRVIVISEGQKKGQKPTLTNVPERPQAPPPTQEPKPPRNTSDN